MDKGEGNTSRKVGEVKMNDMQEILNIAGITSEAIEKGKLVWVVRCEDCDKAKVLSDHVICCNPRNTECQSYPLDWFCADGKRR